MRVYLLRRIAEAFSSARVKGPRNRSPATVFLELLVILMIGLAAGPDILAATELTTLLGLFGVAMFLLTFAVGFRALGRDVFDRLRAFLLPVEYMTLIEMRGNPSARFHGASVICGKVLLMGCYWFIACEWIRALVGLAA